MVALGIIAVAPPAKANVTYKFSPPQAVGPFDPSLTSITVTDAAVAAGSLSFSTACFIESSPYCQGDSPAAAGWVTGFGFPPAFGVADVGLTFEPDGTLSGFINIQWELTDIGWFYQGTGHDWTTICFDGPMEFDGSGFYHRIPEPAALSLLGIGLLGLATVRRRKQH
jgi:hypothetical protein